MFKKLLGKQNTKITARVVFREDAATYGEHGSIYADHKQKNLTNESIPFAFVDVPEIPALDKDVIDHIWKEAAAAGYIPRSLRSYATVMTVKPAPRLQFDSPRIDPQVFRDQARAAAKDMSKQHIAKRQADAVRESNKGLNGNNAPGSSYHSPRFVERTSQ